MPMAFLRAKPIGVMQMIDQGEQDDKARCCQGPPARAGQLALCLPVQLQRGA